MLFLVNMVCYSRLNESHLFLKLCQIGRVSRSSKRVSCRQQTFHLRIFVVSLFWFSSKRETKFPLFCIMHSIFLILYCRVSLRNFVRVIITLDSSLLKKDIWLPRAYFSLDGTCLFKVSRLISQYLWKPLSLLTRFSLNALFIKVSLNVPFEIFWD